ncbi:MAG: PKD domain-containing protein [Candidatus Poseidoniaceae archaeon]|nr:PKD domain-containing protein [Candidatus Poseidoniaceae archaeon]
MKLQFGPLLLAGMMVLVSLSGCIFEDQGSSSKSELLAVFSYSPSDNIRVGDTISFDASSSTPNDGSLTYRWDFDDDSSVDKTGMTAEWSFDSPGSKTIVLTISDGSITSEQVRELTIVAATAVAPSAEITQYNDAEDCENNDLDEDTHIVVWMCHYDKSQTDRDVSETTSITLDASDSDAGSSDEYISEYNWDIDLNIDADNDGDFENDVDFSGETVTWADVEPGEYKIKLNIKNSQDMIDSDTIKVYVSYAAKWSDFEMGGNTSGSGVELDFDVSISYDKDTGNTIRKAVAELTYPQQDGDCTNLPGANNCRAKLDIYAYNEEGDEASNTSSRGLDQRSDGDNCDEANDCVFLTMSSYIFGDGETTYGDGDWTFKIKNDKQNDLQVESFIIRLVYV